MVWLPMRDWFWADARWIFRFVPIPKGEFELGFD
jgi:hypothetical protein